MSITRWHSLLWIILASVTSIANAHPSINRSICLSCIQQLRGGSPAYEPNPSYQNSPATLGDLERNGYHRQDLSAQWSQQSPFQSNQRSRPPPITKLIRDYATELQKFSPTLFNGTMASLLLFILWQFPTSSPVSKILQRHFVCSRSNVIAKKRIHAAFFSAFSHASFHHLLVNMYAFLAFGPSVKNILASQGVTLWVFVSCAAAVSSMAFLALDPRGSASCIGLSGVTLALLAFDSLVYPSKELRMIVSFIPIHLPAYYLFVGLVGFSVLGTLGFVGGRSNVAHSTHLGGLMFGAMFYESFSRGWVRHWSYRTRRLYSKVKGR